jgi:hypothetical protein
MEGRRSNKDDEEEEDEDEDEEEEAEDEEEDEEEEEELREGPLKSLKELTSTPTIVAISRASASSSSF